MDISEIKKIWEDVRCELATVISPSSFDPWIMPLEPIGYENDEFTVLTGHAFAVTVIRKNHYKQIVDAFKKVLGKEVSFNIIFDEKLSQKLKKELEKAEKKAEKKEDPMAQLAQMQSSANLNLRYKLDNFVVGSNSEFAYAAAMSVAKNPAAKYNPLFIYGDSGLGKTHLMQAIGHYVLFNTKLKPKYVKLEEFTNELINNIRKGGDINERMSKFRQKFRNVDVLLLDDIQFIESKGRTIEEVFNTFDSLYNRNKQIVITSDKPPEEIATLPERLKTRFQSGLVVDITPPDFETRLAIISNLADAVEVNISKEVLELIANNFVKNVRELEGAFNKVSAYSSIKQQEISLETAKNILKISEEKKVIDIELITKVICKNMNVTLAELKSSSRQQKISYPRQVAAYIAREMLQLSYVEIAKFLNKKHTTILFYYEKFKKDIQTDRKLQQLIETLKLEIEQ